MGSGPRSNCAYVALMRGINVGGKHLLPMRDLVPLFGEAGCSDARAYIQSGNVVFRARPALARRVPALIGKAVEDRFGLRVPVVVRNADELRAVTKGNPFLKGGADIATLHVAFLADLPSAAGRRARPRPLAARSIRGARPRDLPPVSERRRAHEAHQPVLRFEVVHHEHGSQLEDGPEAPGAGRRVTLADRNDQLIAVTYPPSTRKLAPLT